ncbi:phosphoribosyltransferase [Saccharopolyspora gloriosae]|uniref:phosphoribosyltransferase n=1 Tax=Saccharopolyspora gloriosae TaxID=455344 RepID=UPI001FB6C9EA|nr:phosphoribosyltransferase [Saccharopolyspora gloriosae]
MNRTIATEYFTELAARAGAGFLRNTLRKNGLTCNTCTVPVEPHYPICYKCKQTRDIAGQIGANIANLVVPLSYAIDGTQSGHLMYSYKTMAATRAGIEQLKLLCQIGLVMHWPCIQSIVGRPITAWTTVPSTRTRGSTDHLRSIAQPAINELLIHHKATGQSADLTELRLVTGPGFQEKPRKLIPEMWLPSFDTDFSGHHVLLVEDTWVTGGNAQSTAASLRSNGAQAVTVLTLTRWLNPKTKLVSEFISSNLSHRDYNLFSCPATASDCHLEILNHSI